MPKLHHLPLRAIRATALAAMAAVCGLTALTVDSGAARAESVYSIEVRIRTGGDDLRGDNDNAFVRVGFSDGGTIDFVTEQVNRDDRRIADYTETFLRIYAPEDREITLADLHSFALFVEGFGGGFNGDNWNVDAIQIVANYVDDSGANRSVVVFNEFASPLIRFTGDMHEFRRSFHL